MYPLKFSSIVKPKVWGQEAWLLSGYGDEVSVVTNGYLKGNDLNDLLETYMDELVGGKVYDRYGNYFPLLLKVIDAEDDLSVQVHPNDEQAEAEEQLGKTEMWYVMDAKKGAQVVSGFSQDTSEEEVRDSLADATLQELLRRQPVKKGDVIAIPAGRVHALCKGTKVAEIQESSDLTYRLYDYNRPDKNGQLRPLHVEKAIQVLDWKATESPLTSYECEPNASANLLRDEHFTTNLIRITATIGRDYAPLDSMVIYLCVAGEAVIHALDADAEQQSVSIKEGECVLLPATLNDIRLEPKSAETSIMETYIE